MNIFNSLKNHSLKLLANNFLKAYGGEIIDLFIDREIKLITATIALNGETRPVRITMSEFKITAKNDLAYLSFDKIAVDREWIGIAIDTLLQRFVPDKTIEIPSKLSAILKMII